MKCQTQQERNIESLWGTKELFRHFPVQVEELGQYDDYRSLHHAGSVPSCCGRTRRPEHTRRGTEFYTRSVGPYRHPYIATDYMYGLPEPAGNHIQFTQCNTIPPRQPRVEPKPTCT